MEIANLATTLQIAWYFNRAEKVWHPALKASILWSLIKKFDERFNGMRYIDWKYFMNINKIEFIEFSSFDWLLEYTKNYIQSNFNKIQNLVKNDPMLFIR